MGLYFKMPEGTNLDAALITQVMGEAGLRFPLIVKPNRSDRHDMVAFLFFLLIDFITQDQIFVPV